MLKNLIEKLRAKLPVTTCGYSMVKFAHLHDAFSEFLELEARTVEGQSLQQKGKKRRKKGVKKLKETEKPKEVSHYTVQKTLISARVRAKCRKTYC